RSDRDWSSDVCSSDLRWNATRRPSSDTSQLQPALAATWEVSDDGLRVAFHLRAGLTFSDGTQLSGQDVVGSWLRLLDPAHPSPQIGRASCRDGGVDDG